MLRREFLKRSVACSAAIFAFATASLIGTGPSPLQVMFYGGSLPSVQSELEKRVKLQLLVAGQDPKKQEGDEDNVVRLEQLKETDLWIGSANKRNFPSAAQLDNFQNYLVAGKPAAMTLSSAAVARIFSAAVSLRSRLVINLRHVALLLCFS